MHDPFAWFWTAMIVGSIAWYSYLVFYVGWRGGQDIVRMVRALAEKDPLKGDER